MKNKKLFTISIAIPTFNEEKNIDLCLGSVFSQDYPQELVEVIVVDDYSTDRTINKAKKFPVKILYNGNHDAEIGKMIGFKAATGDLFYYLDADAELRGHDWLRKMIAPLETDGEIVGVFTKEFAYEKSTSIERYFSLDPLLRDPLHEFFSPSIDSVTIKKLNNYVLCKFTPNKIPPAGRCLYKKDLLYKLIKKEDRFMEMDILWLLVNKGFTKFAYVPEAGIYHHYITSLLELIEKRKRNIQKVYLNNIEKRKYRWIDTSKFLDILKTLAVVLYANTFVFSTLRGIYKTLKYKNIAGLWEPIISFVSVNTVIFSILSHKKGLRFILNLYKSL